MPPMDTDRIPTQPTTDQAPPGATSLAPGPSQAPTSQAAGRGRRTAAIGSAVVLALVVTFTAGIGVGRLFAPAGASTDAPNPASPGTTDFGLIKEAWDTLHQQYVGRDELDDRSLIYGAIAGMTEAVGDTGHTDFMTPEERKQRDDSLSGSYVGIGVRIEPDPAGLPQIIGVFEDSPAEKAGLKPDDVIVAVDGKRTEDSSIDEVAGWVRGEAGTTVELTVRTGADGPERTVSVIRGDVPIRPVSWTMVPGTKTALIRLEQFSNGAADDMVETLKTARADGAERIVLDMRGNPGGYVNEAVGVASQFLTSGLVYIERNAQGGTTDHPVSPGGVATDLPLVVVVNANTASSAEIVSGALQDAGRAKVVGETTFGTGTVLGEFELSDGSALRVGTVEWLTPSGRRIWHEGIAPDVPITMPADVDPLSPEDVARLTSATVGSIDDTQLAKALEVVSTQQVASTR